MFSNKNIKYSSKILNKTSNNFLICLNSINFFRNKSFINESKIIYKKNNLMNRLIYIKNEKVLDAEDYNTNIFITHLINKEQIYIKKDLYLDYIIESVTKKNKGIRMFINHNNLNLEIPYLENLKSIIIRKSIYLLNDIGVIIFFLYNFIKLKLRLIYRKQGVNRFLDKEVKFLNSISSSANLILAKNILKIISKKKKQNIFIPFEGHSWEKILIKLIKEKNPKAKIFYYQFNLNDKDLLMIDFLKNKNFQPSYLLFSGNIAKNKFEEKNIKIKSLLIGSNRIQNILMINDKYNIKCLVIPEGFDSEIELFVNFIKECRYLKNKFKFIFRIPPHLDKNYCIEKYDLNRLNFCSISENKSLSDDIKSCSFVLFRGSSAIFNSLYNGLIGIYLMKNDKDRNIPFPLVKDMENFIYFVNSSSNFDELISKEISDKDKLRIKEIFENYYFSNYNDNNLLKLL